jgi:plasmid stability protein
MPSLNVRNLSVEVLEALKRRARAHHRSLNGEVMAILEEAARNVPPAEGHPPIRLHHVSVGGRDPLRREELYGDEGR